MAVGGEPGPRLRRRRFILALRQTLSQSERNHIVKKLDKAKRERFIDAGLGWPAAVRFGFKRERDRTIVVDEEQWPTIKFIHYNYERAEHDKKSAR